MKIVEFTIRYLEIVFLFIVSIKKYLHNCMIAIRIPEEAEMLTIMDHVNISGTLILTQVILL